MFSYGFFNFKANVMGVRQIVERQKLMKKQSQFLKIVDKKNLQEMKIAEYIFYFFTD